MRKVALALAAAAVVGFSLPVFSTDASAASGRMQLAQADVSKTVKIRRGPAGVTKKVVVRRDRGLHRGWAHSRHYGATKKKVVIKHRGNRTVVKKKIMHRS